jgi:hypothetical protein
MFSEDTQHCGAKYKILVVREDLYHGVVTEL